MPTSTVRAVIMVAAVAIGVLILTKAFPSAAPFTAPPGGGSTPTGTPSNSPTPRTSHSNSPTPSVSPKVAGVVVQVLNGSTGAGLATSTTNTLKNAGYDTRTPGNAPATAQTTVYYASDSKVDAQYLQQKYFPDAALKPAPSTFPADIQITVVLGQDFADSASSPNPSASPSA